MSEQTYKFGTVRTLMMACNLLMFGTPKEFSMVKKSNELTITIDVDKLVYSTRQMFLQFPHSNIDDIE